MKVVAVLALMLGTLLCSASRADTSTEFVRLACVHEAGLLEAEFRYLHDSVAPDGPKDRRSVALARETASRTNVW